MRTNIEIDDALMGEAMDLSGYRTAPLKPKEGLNGAPSGGTDTQFSMSELPG
jgi:Bacterial antitoxin of type II TA system, VapB